jgi:hypothetical protein
MRNITDQIVKSGNDDLDYVTEKYLILEEEVGALRLKIKTKLEKLGLTRLIPEFLPEYSKNDENKNGNKIPSLAANNLNSITTIQKGMRSYNYGS